MTNREAVAFFTDLATSNPDGTAVLPRKAKAEPGVCWCGCGGLTKSKFVPGHDARFHAMAKNALRGKLDQQECLDSLPHDDAREEFVAYQEKIGPAEAARAKVEAAKAAAKEAVRLAKEAAKEVEESDVEDEVAVS